MELYVFLGDNLIEFQFKGKNPFVLLSPCDGCDGYEIEIGGSTNTMSMIMEEKHTQNYCDRPPRHQVPIYTVIVSTDTKIFANISY